MRALLRLIYESDEMTAGQLFRLFKKIVPISYIKFYEMLMKLENLKLIDTKYDQRRRG